MTTRILLVLMLLTRVATAAPFLVSDPYTPEDKITKFDVIMDGAAAVSPGGALHYDLQGLPTGDHKASARACNNLGCSEYSQELQFSLPLAQSGVMRGLNIQAFASWGVVPEQRMLESGTELIRVARQGKLQAENDAIRVAGANGIKVLLMCGFNRVPNITTDANARQKYADMCASDIATVDVAQAIKYVEAWNEWNGGMGLGCAYWESPCNDGALYVDLLCRVHKAVKAIRPDIQVLGGTMAGASTGFFGKMLDAGADKCMDAVSWHFYPMNKFAQCRAKRDATPQEAAELLDTCVARLDSVARGKLGKSVPMMISEVGMTDEDDAKNQARVAEFLTAVYAVGSGNPLVQGLIWYSLPRVGKYPRTLGMGMFDAAGKAKPSYRAFQALSFPGGRRMRIEE